MAWWSASRPAEPSSTADLRENEECVNECLLENDLCYAMWLLRTSVMKLLGCSGWGISRGFWVKMQFLIFTTAV